MGQLEDCGIKCFAQDGSGVTEGLTAVVVSTAIEDTNPDLKRAKELGIPVMHRSEMLAKISKEAKTIAVSGTSGKSTVTAMIYHILQYAGLQPSVMTGAGLVNLQKEGKIGNAVSGKGEWLVVEADESDGTLVRYEPEIGLILNVDKDHKEMSELHMPTLDTAIVYPGMCLFEATNVSEGRGTTRPFEIFGAPFIDAVKLCKYMNGLKLPGVYFRENYFQPTFHKGAGQICGGAQIHVLDRDKFRSFDMAVKLLQYIFNEYPNDFAWKQPPYEYEFKNTSPCPYTRRVRLPER